MFTDKEYFWIGTITIILLSIIVMWILALAFKNKTSKWLIGTDNLRFYTKELIKTIHAKEDSIISMKRVFSWISFGVMQWGLIHWLIININTIDFLGITAWSAIEGVICGYQINRIAADKTIKPADTSGG